MSTLDGVHLSTKRGNRNDQGDVDCWCFALLWKCDNLISRKTCFSFHECCEMFNKKKTKLEISAPTNFQHRVHTGYDSKNRKLIGLPRQWTSLVSDAPFKTISRSLTQPNMLMESSSVRMKFKKYLFSKLNWLAVDFSWF